MADKTVKIQVPGLGVVDGVEVQVTESTERWSDATLSDGSAIRIKPVILTVIRLVGHWDQEGNPLYQVKTNQVMSANHPDHLKRDAEGPSNKAH